MANGNGNKKWLPIILTWIITLIAAIGATHFYTLHSVSATIARMDTHMTGPASALIHVSPEQSRVVARKEAQSVVNEFAVQWTRDLAEIKAMVLVLQEDVKHISDK